MTQSARQLVPGDARIVQVSISPGGVPKTAVGVARVTAMGLEADAHREPKYHGGPDRAVCLYSHEAIEALRAEGHSVVPGSLGENLTVQGLEWSAVGPGTRLRVGPSVVLEVTSYTAPCVKIADMFAGRRFGRVSQTQNPGWSRVYARVLAGGTITTGDPVVRIEATDPAAAPPLLAT